MDENAINVYKDYISNLQGQLSTLNDKIDNLQSTVEVCKDSVNALNTTIANSSNYWSLITSTNGVIVVAIVMAVICVIALKKGISLSKNGATISIGGDNDEKGSK